MVLAPAPVDEQVLGQERSHDHAHSVVHPSGLLELAHASVDDWVARAAFFPGFEPVFAVLPGDVSVMPQKSGFFDIGPVPEDGIVELPPDDFFQELDKEFINLKSAKDDNFVYKGADVLVQTTWELPIIIQWPGSSIKFEFSTSQGAIEFGIVFVPALAEDQQEVTKLIKENKSLRKTKNG